MTIAVVIGQIYVGTGYRIMSNTIIEATRTAASSPFDYWYRPFIPYGDAWILTMERGLGTWRKTMQTKKFVLKYRGIPYTKTL